MKNIYFLKKLSAVIMLFAAAGYAQDTDPAKIKAMAEKACECTKGINIDQPRDSIVKKVNTCITDEIIKDQTFGTMAEMGKLVDEAVANMPKSDTLIEVGGGKTYTITVDKDFDEIQSYMFTNCIRMKNLISANNQQLDYSMSKNKKALEQYNEGANYEAREMYDMAIVSYNKALKIDPKFSFAWDNLGLCYRKRGNYKEAIKCYEKSLELDPKGTMPLQNIAVAYEYLKDYKKASSTYEKMIKLHPDNPEGYFGAGRVYYLDESYSKGVDYMFQAYKMYAAVQSPYVNDAQQNLQYYYGDLKEKGKPDIFKDAAKKNNINIE